jgi:membrane-bound serine protease (ClpP class)
VIVPAVLVTAGFFLFAVAMALRAQRPRAKTGTEGMIGEEATVVEELAPVGKVFLRGELWTATAADRIPRGARVRVLSVEGLQLRVQPLQGGTPVKEG